MDRGVNWRRMRMVSRSSLHPLLRLEVGGVKVRVQQDDGKGQDKDGVRGVQFAEIMQIIV